MHNKVIKYHWYHSEVENNNIILINILTNRK